MESPRLTVYVTTSGAALGADNVLGRGTDVGLARGNSVGVGVGIGTGELGAAVTALLTGRVCASFPLSVHAIAATAAMVTPARTVAGPAMLVP